MPPKNSLANATPGRQPRHYAPTTPLVVGGAGKLSAGIRKGLLSLGLPTPREAGEYAAVEILSEQGCLAEAACKLFAALRRLDNSHLDIIVATTFPNHGLGRAINDRLSRASR